MPESTNPLLLGLTGFPLGHSKSPLLHAAALKNTGLAGEYKLFPVEPVMEGQTKLIGLLKKIRDGEIHGLNVTIPHKQNVIPLLDRLSEGAAAIGAVNTICLEHGQLVGHNTDAEGFRLDLHRIFGIPPTRALVLGAGGSARAVVHALTQDGWQIAIAARRESQAESLAPDYVFEFPLRAERVAQFKPALIINTTPLGMAPNQHTSPWPNDLAFPEEVCIYDLVYNPEDTKLLKQAAQNDLRAAGGLGMLIEQAALAFEIWTGRRPSRKAMQLALNT